MTPDTQLSRQASGDITHIGSRSSWESGGDGGICSAHLTAVGNAGYRRTWRLDIPGLTVKGGGVVQIPAAQGPSGSPDHLAELPAKCSHCTQSLVVEQSRSYAA